MESELYIDFTNFAHAQFDRLGVNFSIAALNRVHRDLLRLSRLMLRFQYNRRMAREYLRHLRGLALLQNRHQFLMNV